MQLGTDGVRAAQGSIGWWARLLREVAHVWPTAFRPRSRILGGCPTCAAAAAGSG